MKWAAAGIAGYEVVSIAAGKTPTLTMLARRHRWLGPLLVAALAVHLYCDGRAAS